VPLTDSYVANVDSEARVVEILTLEDLERIRPGKNARK
jgi:hypothetical protein